MTAVDIEHFTYTLPPERIAAHPLADRDQSKLLVYKGGKIEHTKFQSLPDLLPENTTLFFNDTKVIPARLHFSKDTGAAIEIFLLSPVAPAGSMAEAMQARTNCTWKCTIGNLKRWNDTHRLSKKINRATLSATLVDRKEGLVLFTWDGGASFAEIITQAGETPLPPYIKRKPNQEDRTRYQTVYSHYEGAVAAPTAGLHFTENVFQKLKHKGIGTDFLTLHVSAGTFQPIKVSNALDHNMHLEQIIVNRQNIENLLREDRFVIAVGTTSMRTLESLYWYGVKLLHNENVDFTITQHDPYSTHETLPTKIEALKAVASFMDKRGLDSVTGTTGIYIVPGYTFRICRGLITNFHQPGSTLILLVAAFVGNDWRKIYQEAMENDYRFLSYGDSSLLLP